MKYNPYGELRAHFGADAVWEDIDTARILVLLEDDLDKAIAEAPESPTSPEQCTVCLVAQAGNRGFGSSKTLMFPRIFYWQAPGNPCQVHRGEIEDGLGTQLVEAFDLAAQSGDWAPVRAALPCEVRLIPPTGDKKLEKRRAHARATRNRPKSKRRDPRKKENQTPPEPKRVRRDGMVLVEDGVEQMNGQPKS